MRTVGQVAGKDSAEQVGSSIATLFRPEHGSWLKKYTWLCWPWLYRRGW